MPFLRKYGTGTGSDVIIPMVKAGSIDHAVSADWTPATGDVKVSKDGGAAANISTLPAYITSIGWKFVFSDAELQCARLNVQVTDSATKAVEDQHFVVETFGNASAMYAADFDDSVRLGLTALPNAAADAAGGLPISDAGGLDLDGRLDAAVSSRLAAASIPQAFTDFWTAMITGTAQAGGASTITLAAGASSTPGFYDDMVVFIVSGTGAGQTRKISSDTTYNGTTKVATVTEAWAVQPDNTSVYQILGRIEP